ncbi:MAG: L-threonylcarbamoyladenylate synthase [Dehalococcoidia bacterium]
MVKEVSATDPSCVAEAVAVLRQGGLVCLPTDTVYGLAAAAGTDDAEARLYDVQGRALDKPLPVFLADAAEMAVVCAQVPPLALRLAEAFWPGGLTLVLRRATTFRSLALAGGDTVAVRVPDLPLVLAVVRGLGEPMTGTSANLSGQPSPVTAAAARGQVGQAVDLFIDGGDCGGVESTVVDLTGEKPLAVVRRGAVAVAELEGVLGEVILASEIPTFSSEGRPH